MRKYNTADNRTTIRNLDPELMKQARKDAIDKSLTIGFWLNKAIKRALGKK